MARTTTKRTSTGRAGTKRPGAKQDGKTDFADQVLETALDLAEDAGWQSVRLHDIADRLGVPPGRILEHYRDTDSIADKWLRRGLDAMIAPKDSGFADLPAQQRIEICLLAWFDALVPHRSVTAAMVRGKMHLSHPHHWVPMIFNLSRTIQWLREAALLPASYGTRRAQIEETGLTGLFLATFAVWARDDTPGQDRTRQFLRRRLDRADRLMAGLFGKGRASVDTAD